MTRKNLWVCHRCGDEATTASGPVMNVRPTGWRVFNPGLGAVDLCAACSKQLDRFLEGGPVPALPGRVEYGPLQHHPSIDIEGCECLARVVCAEGANPHHVQLDCTRPIPVEPARPRPHS